MTTSTTPTWQPHPDGGECLTIPGTPGVHLGAWVNPTHGPTWSAAFDKQGSFPQHADTLDEAKADAIAHAERHLGAIVAAGEEAARMLAVLRGAAERKPLRPQRGVDRADPLCGVGRWGDR